MKIVELRTNTRAKRIEDRKAPVTNTHRFRRVNEPEDGTNATIDLVQWVSLRTVISSIQRRHVSQMKCTYSGQSHHARITAPP